MQELADKEQQAMQELKEQNIIFRSFYYFILLTMGLGGLEFLGEFIGRNLIKRRYRLAYWAALVISLLFWALLIGAGVAWIVTGQSPEESTSPSGVLAVAAMLEVFVGGFVVGGLVGIGWIAEGTEETERFARAWSQTYGKAQIRSAREDTSFFV